MRARSGGPAPEPGFGIDEAELIEAIEFGCTTRANLRQWFAIAMFQSDRKLRLVLDKLSAEGKIRWNAAFREWEVVS